MRFRDLRDTKIERIYIIRESGDIEWNMHRYLEM